MKLFGKLWRYNTLFLSNICRNCGKITIKMKYTSKGFVQVYPVIPSDPVIYKSSLFLVYVTFYWHYFSQLPMESNHRTYLAPIFFSFSCASPKSCLRNESHEDAGWSVSNLFSLSTLSVYEYKRDTPRLFYVGKIPWMLQIESLLKKDFILILKTIGIAFKDFK